MNEYRVKVGSGRSQTFGIVGRRCLPPDYSRQNWLRPYLYKLLVDFGNEYVEIPWNAITVNQNYRAGRHYDKHNKGDSYLVAFGDYAGGDLEIHEGDLSGTHNIWCRPIVADFSKILHSVSHFTGERYSLVYYWFETPRSVLLPEPSVRYEEDRWWFYRGDQRLSRKNGLPHPLCKDKEKPETTTDMTGMKIESKNKVLEFR